MAENLATSLTKSGAIRPQKWRELAESWATKLSTMKIIHPNYHLT